MTDPKPAPESAAAESEAERKLRELFGGNADVSGTVASDARDTPLRSWRPAPGTALAGGSGPLVMVCVNHRRDGRQPSCAARGGVALAEAVEAAAARVGLDGRVQRTYCLGHCQFGPTVRVAPGGPFFRRAAVADIPAIIEALKTLSESD